MIFKFPFPIVSDSPHCITTRTSENLHRMPFLKFVHPGKVGGCRSLVFDTRDRQEVPGNRDSRNIWQKKKSERKRKHQCASEYGTGIIPSTRDTTCSIGEVPALVMVTCSGGLMSMPRERKNKKQVTRLCHRAI